MYKPEYARENKTRKDFQRIWETDRLPNQGVGGPSGVTIKAMNCSKRVRTPVALLRSLSGK